MPARSCCWGRSGQEGHALGGGRGAELFVQRGEGQPASQRELKIGSVIEGKAMLVREARRRGEGDLEPQHVEFHSHGLGVFQRSCETFPGKPSASEGHEKNIGHFQRPKAGSNRWLIRQIGKFRRGCLAQKLSYGDRGIKDEFSHLRALFPPGVPEFQDLLDGQRLEALFAQFQA